MYIKNKLTVPIVDFNNISVRKFHKLFGYNNYNIIYKNNNNYNNRARYINSKLYGIYIIKKYEK